MVGEGCYILGYYLWLGGDSGEVSDSDKEKWLEQGNGSFRWSLKDTLKRWKIEPVSHQKLNV